MKHQPFTIILHIALVIIVAGALTTHFFGIQGYLTLFSGNAPVIEFAKESGPGKGMFPFTVSLYKAEIEYHPDTDLPKDYRSQLLIDGKEMSISMNHFGHHDGWRFCQSDMGSGYSSFEVSHDPWGIGITYIGYILLGIGMIGYFFQPNTQWRAMLRKYERRKDVLTATATAVSLAILYLVWYASRPLPPVLVSRLLPLHVMVVIMAYTLFLIMAVLAVLALATKSQNQCKSLSTLNRILLAPAVCLLGAGIFIGAVWANQTWGRYWAWDPKETCALMMWLVYALPLHRGCRPLRCFQRDKTFNIYLLIAILTVAFTYFGANYLLPGLHSYAILIMPVVHIGSLRN